MQIIIANQWIFRPKVAKNICFDNIRNYIYKEDATLTARKKYIDLKLIRSCSVRSCVRHGV